MHQQGLGQQSSFSFDLTDEQKQVLSAVLDFVNSDADCFILKGVAGSGKTFLLSAILYELHRSNIHLQLMAPTGRAARIIRNKTGFPARTIHSSIYGAGKISERKGDNAFKLTFQIKTSVDPGGTVYIADEASMISDVLYEKDNTHLQFGTGKLLTDLFTYANSGPCQNKPRFIFVGDPYQLPPVGSSESPALDESYLREKVGLQVRTAELKSVVRQKADSGILKVASRLRRSLDRDVYNCLDLATQTEDVRDLTDSEVEESYVSKWKALGKEEVLLVVYTNEMAQSYNQRVRERLFPGVSSPVITGDRLIVTQNNRHSELLNGDFVTVIESSDMVKTVGPIKNILLTFRDILVSPDDGRDPFWCKILENHLTSADNGSSSEIMQALWIHFKSRHRTLNPKNPEFAEKLEQDPYFNALRVKHGYAITCHKSQGGEWQHVFVAFDEKQGKANKFFFRWTYTAITRAQEQLLTIDKPSFNPASLITFQGRPGRMQESSIDGVHVSDIQEQLARAGMSVNTHSLAYRCRWIVARDGNSCRMDVMYRGNDVISNVTIEKLSGTDDANLQQLCDELKQFSEPWRGKRLLGIEANGGCNVRSNGARRLIEIPEFPQDKPFLKVFYDELSSKLKPKGIKIQAVTHHQWFERYRFVSDSEAKAIDFYYNRKLQFTKAVPHGNGSVTLYEIIKEEFDGPTGT